MSHPTPPPQFEALDACHRQIQIHLSHLATLAAELNSGNASDAHRRRAAEVEAFFSNTSRAHHAEEEKLVFPPLLARGDDRLTATVRSLQQDHGFIEEDWIELAPQLRAIAAGNEWVDAAEFQHNMQVFIDLCRDHIALEETLIYPASKSQWAATVAARTAHPA